MLNLVGFVHRQALAEIIARWMVDEPHPGDVRLLKRIVNFNSYIARVWVHHLGHMLLSTMHGQEPELRILHSKGELKDFVVEHPTYTTPRIEKMRAKYRRFPEDYYRETPIDGGYYVLNPGGEERFVGGMRIKRFRRIAEKGSRRIIDFMLNRIRQNADALADERAQRLGISTRELYTPPEEMAEEFAHAERRFIKSIKRKTIQSELPMLDIPDVVGLKLIVENNEYKRLLTIINSDPRCRLEEVEEHTGLYNAVNMKVRFQLPKELLLELPPMGKDLQVLASRGFDVETVHAEYVQFIKEAEDDVMVEIIASSFEEYMESEIGRCMHEERVLDQRSTKAYSGNLATNVRYLMGYILGLCRASAQEIDEIPIKLWVKYMPDTIENVMRGLALSNERFFDSSPSHKAIPLGRLELAACN
ncbi:MAG: hypothetical protein AUK47_00635 [Deltaproteobacteria bacterium CG2_30_63_29]|nr:MAG: hypothetical protein AUK47_00635 [Deltaproteobacteria bacterium CG2_30_63_29]PJB39350.1 MAG: hypothetical protein CO108_17370 [Deltaproteobacteria bacterium CG_4_9_14_3_um_filter_63_12]